ncbi:hypothetical protein ACH5RR_028499 [Cinchona calisaya]|uniref:Uncharacterized protein n=1 Tax=Cinchona calisaya TaxID=153742 RepID=A0ABD2YP03_9GENT
MSSEEELTLFDFYWFEHCILRKKQPFISNSNLDLNEEFEPKLNLSSTPSFIVRSFSDQALSSKDNLFTNSSDDNSPSPKSVLHLPKLQTILSGKEVGEFSSSEGGKRRKMRKGGRRSNNISSKSLSELEFEELKGFMDLGFVFSDEDKDSSLVSIIPGLQRLGRKDEEEEKKGNYFVDESAVSRPYLSEAWDVLDEKKAERKVKKQLMNWRINPALGNEMEIKDQLRFWAHTVASTVK